MKFTTTTEESNMTNLFTYVVLTQHGVERTERWSAPFSNADSEIAAQAAYDYAQSISPDRDGSVCPNVDDEILEREMHRLDRSVFWYRNRFAIIISTERPSYY